MTTLSPHPFLDDFPPSSEDEYERLKSRIERAGCIRVPIHVLGDKIIDGRHRYRASQELNIECPVVEVDLIEGETLWDYICDLNERRDYTASQRAMIAESRSERFKKEAAERMRQAASGTLPDEVQRGRAVDLAGAKLGVSGSSVERARRLKKESPELAKKVLAGEMSLGSALLSIAKAAPPPDDDETETDGLGVKQDEPRVVAALRELPRFRTIANRLHAIKRDIAELAESECGAEIRADQVELHIKNAVTAIRFAEPFTACPLGKQNCKRGCKVCGGKRWITKEQYDRLPPGEKP